MFLNFKDTNDLATPVAGESQHETVTRIVEDMLKQYSTEEIARDPIFVQLYASSALATMDYSAWEKALQVLEKAAPESLASTDSFVLTHLLAEARLRTGRTAGALAAAERALELFPNEGTTVRQYVIAAVAEGRRKDAVRVLKAAIAAGPQDSPDVLTILRVLDRRLKARREAKLPLPLLVADLADPVSLPEDAEALFGGVTTLYDVALKRELLRAIVSDPKKHAKNLRILKATEPVLTEEGVFTCRSSLQEEGFPIEFNIPYAGISMIAPEALRSLARGVVTGDFGRVGKVRVENPFDATVFTADGKEETVSLLSYFGSTCAESRLTGDEPVFREMTAADACILNNPMFRPDEDDRRGWLDLIANWVSAGAYPSLALLEDLRASTHVDFVCEFARATLIAKNETCLMALQRKNAIKILNTALSDTCDEGERFRILQLLGMALFLDERLWDAVQTFKQALEIRMDSTVLVSMGYALAANSSGLLDEPFDVRKDRVWSLLTTSAETLRRHIRSANASGRSARDAVSPAMTVLCGDWVERVGFENDDPTTAVVQLACDGDKMQLLPQLEFVKRMPLYAHGWKFEIGARRTLGVDKLLADWLKPVGLKSIRIYPQRDVGMVELSVFLERSSGSVRPYQEQFAKGVVIAALGEAPFLEYCSPEIAFLDEPLEGEKGYTPSEFAEYFFHEFPQALNMSGANVTLQTSRFENPDALTGPLTPLFTDINSGDVLSPELFDPAIFVDPKAPGLRFSRLMQSYGAQPVTIAFEVVRWEGMTRFDIDVYRRVVINDLTDLIERSGAAQVVGTAYGEERAYINAILWRPDRALYDVANWLANEKRVAWAVYRSLFPLTFFETLCLNDPSTARAAIEPLGRFAKLDEHELADPSSVVKKFEAAFEEGLERRKRTDRENSERGDVFTELDDTYEPADLEPEYGGFAEPGADSDFGIDVSGAARSYAAIYQGKSKA